MDRKKYTDEGYLIVSESDQCPLWEKNPQPGFMWCTKDCFYCRFADFRTEEFIMRAEEIPRSEKLYSVCRNEKNKNDKGETR